MWRVKYICTGVYWQHFFKNTFQFFSEFSETTIKCLQWFWNQSGGPLVKMRSILDKYKLLQTGDPKYFCFIDPAAMILSAKDVYIFKLSRSWLKARRRMWRGTTLNRNEPPGSWRRHRRHNAFSVSWIHEIRQLGDGRTTWLSMHSAWHRGTWTHTCTLWRSRAPPNHS